MPAAVAGRMADSGACAPRPKKVEKEKEENSEQKVRSVVGGADGSRSAYNGLPA